MDLLTIKQALISMGYRKMGEKDTGEDVYGKPVGLGLLMAEITNEQSLLIYTVFKGTNGNILRWGRYEIKCSPADENEMLYDDITLYNAYCYKIGVAEIEAGVSKITAYYDDDETFAFKNDYDVYQIIY